MTTSLSDQVALNKAGARCVLDALALAAGPGGVVAVNEDGALAVHQAPSDDACNCDHALELTGALRALVVGIGDGRVLNMSSHCALAYTHAVAVLRRYDGADIHAADAERVAAQFGGAR